MSGRRGGIGDGRYVTTIQAPRAICGGEVCLGSGRRLEGMALLLGVGVGVGVVGVVGVGL
jgi:hypothetical protein